MNYNEWLNLETFDSHIDKLQIFKTLFKVHYRERNIYEKDKLTVGFSNIFARKY